MEFGVDGGCIVAFSVGLVVVGSRVVDTEEQLRSHRCRGLWRSLDDGLDRSGCPGTGGQQQQHEISHGGRIPKIVLSESPI